MRPSSRLLPTLAAYATMLAVAAGLYVGIRSLGSGLTAPPRPEDSPVPAATESVLPGVLLALAAIAVATRAGGALVRRYLRQPPVLGEILAGLLLGPSLLGAIWPAANEFLLPPAAAPYLGLLAKVGVVLFMFLVGLDLDARVLAGSGHSTLAISHASIAVPFVLGATLALWLYPRYGTADVSFTVFSLFTGVAMSVTAFPVLARILSDRGAGRTSLGVTALACAAVGDASAWTLLAIVMGVASRAVGGALRTIPLVLAFVAFTIVAVRPLLARLAARVERDEGPLGDGTLAVVVVALLLSAWATETIGVHALFGAFLLGAVLPHEGRLARQLRERIRSIVVVLLLPAFFAFTGMHTRIGLVAGPEDWLFCGLVVAVATAGKFGGTFVAGRLAGLGWRPAAALGALMNTRGLMELIVLDVGLEMGVLTPKLFAMFVVMAIATTFATGPALSLVLGRRGFDETA